MLQQDDIETYGNIISRGPTEAEASVADLPEMIGSNMALETKTPDTLDLLETFSLSTSVLEDVADEDFAVRLDKFGKENENIEKAIFGILEITPAVVGPQLDALDSLAHFSLGIEVQEDISDEDFADLPDVHDKAYEHIEASLFGDVSITPEFASTPDFAITPSSLDLQPGLVDVFSSSTVQEDVTDKDFADRLEDFQKQNEDIEDALFDDIGVTPDATATLVQAPPKVCNDGKNPNPVLKPESKFSTLPAMTLRSQKMRDTRYQSSKEDFETAALLISSGENVSSETFTVLRIVTRKLLKKDMKYRTLDTTLPRVQQGLLGYEGVLEFLQTLGFRADQNMTKLCIEANQPPRSVIHSALSVIEDRIRKFEYQKSNMQKLRQKARVSVIPTNVEELISILSEYFQGMVPAIIAQEVAFQNAMSSTYVAKVNNMSAMMEIRFYVEEQAMSESLSYDEGIRCSPSYYSLTPHSYFEIWKHLNYVYSNKDEITRSIIKQRGSTTKFLFAPDYRYFKAAVGTCFDVVSYNFGEVYQFSE